MLYVRFESVLIYFDGSRDSKNKDFKNMCLLIKKVEKERVHEEQ